MLPDGSTATSVGLFNDVLVAETLSSGAYHQPPPYPPFPATVEITPVLILILRIRLFRVSAM